MGRNMHTQYGDQTRNLGMSPDRVWNWQPFGAQHDAPASRATRPGPDSGLVPGRMLSAGQVETSPWGPQNTSPSLNAGNGSDTHCYSLSYYSVPGPLLKCLHTLSLLSLMAGWEACITPSTFPRRRD